MCGAKTRAGFGWTPEVVPEPARQHQWCQQGISDRSFLAIPFPYSSAYEKSKCSFLSKISFSGWSKDESWITVELCSYHWFSFYHFPVFFLFLLTIEVAKISSYRVEIQGLELKEKLTQIFICYNFKMKVLSWVKDTLTCSVGCPYTVYLCRPLCSF